MVESLNAKDPNDTSSAYTSFSGRFTMSDMTGKAGQPVPSDTKPLPLGFGAPSTTSDGIVGTTTLPVPSGVTPTVTSQSSVVSAQSQGSSTASSASAATSAALGSSSSLTSNAAVVAVRFNCRGMDPGMIMMVLMMVLGMGVGVFL